MKNFTALCRMSQHELKSYMEAYLEEYGYEPINEDGFLYAKGDIPVLLIAHMDTVHKMSCTEIKEVDGKISSPQGIGGDDRCGAFIIAEIIKELQCSVLLCEEEEVGCIGARKFRNTEYINDLDVNYMVEFDRKGNKDAVFYRCDNPEFTEFVTSTTGFEKAYGSYSDISVVAPAAGIAAVNLSSGYYNAHTTDEYVIYKEMLNTIDAAKKLILTESEPFEYIEQKYVAPTPIYNSSRDYYGGYVQTSLFDYAKDDMMIHLEVVFVDQYGEENSAESEGNTKAEAWANFFMGNPDVCFNMIEDYSFM